MSDAPLLAGINLHKTYQLGRTNVPVLHGASIDVNEGEWVSILGSSGSGKSTLMHLLGGLDRPDNDDSEVLFKEESVWSKTNSEINRYRNQDVGFVFQFYHLLPELNVLENVVLPSIISGRSQNERASNLLEQFGLSHRIGHRPRELSGGERQRVAIARALINNPSVLLADEPTGNLDEDTGTEILDVLKQLHDDGLTIVMVTHDNQIANRADRTVHLKMGLIE